MGHSLAAVRPEGFFVLGGNLLVQNPEAIFTFCLGPAPLLGLNIPPEAGTEAKGENCLRFLNQQNYKFGGAPGG